MKHISFTKLSGTGNDFVAVIGTDIGEHDPGWLASRLCQRAMSIGADGLILVDHADNAGVTIHFYNPDGSPAEACGNGSRCAARFAVEHRMVSSQEFNLYTESGNLPVVIESDGRFRVTMPSPAETSLHYTQVTFANRLIDIHRVQVGVPHAVAFVDDIEHFTNEDLLLIGRNLRYSSEFPSGVNTNFVQVIDAGTVRQRTYERGVENLTMACGTGSTATTHVLRKLYDISSPLEVRVDGGIISVDLDETGTYWLIGDARVVATGLITHEALEW